VLIPGHEIGAAGALFAMEPAQNVLDDAKRLVQLTPGALTMGERRVLAVTIHAALWEPRAAAIESVQLRLEQ
jgi:hypothetical protein